MRKLAIPLITALALAAAPAYADRSYRDGRGGGHRSHHHQGGGSSIWPGVAVIGAIAGLAILAERSRPVYASPYSSYPGYPSYPAQPVYVEPPHVVAPARGNSQPWYYCQSSAMYYPYTQACPEGWQPVPASPY